MKVLVAGATGAIGSYLLPRLLDAGHTVIGLTRTDAGAERIRRAGVEPVVAELLDADGLRGALRGHRADAVIHQATALDRPPILHRHLYRTDALRREGTENLLRVARDVGAHRFLTQSFFLGYGYRDHGPGRLTEDSPFGGTTGDAFDPHQRAMRANESQAFTTDGIEGIALRYGLFYGADPATRALVDLVRRRRLPVTSPTGVTAPVHLADAADATVAALERGRPGQAYNIADDTPLPFTEFVRAIAAAVGAGEPRTVPGWVLRPVPYLHALMVSTRIRLDTTKAARELGWTPRFPSCREGFASEVPA